MWPVYTVTDVPGCYNRGHVPPQETVVAGGRSYVYNVVYFLGYVNTFVHLW
jgi:hypothetical protein